jgi:hypothetical protein
MYVPERDLHLRDSQGAEMGTQTAVLAATQEMSESVVERTEALRQLVTI